MGGKEPRIISAGVDLALVAGVDECACHHVGKDRYRGGCVGVCLHRRGATTTVSVDRRRLRSLPSATPPPADFMNACLKLNGALDWGTSAQAGSEYSGLRLSALGVPEEGRDSSSRRVILVLSEKLFSG